MEKIRILQLPIANSKGGRTHYALNLWNYLDKNKFKCDFATWSEKLDFEDEITLSGAQVLYLSSYPEENEEVFRNEFAAILKNNYDVVHIHTSQWKNTIIEEMCREYHVQKVIVHAHNTSCGVREKPSLEEELYIHKKIRNSIDENLASDYWACSSEAGEWLYGNSIPKEKITLRHNAIDIYKFRFSETYRNEVRQELGIDNDVFLIGNVGRMVYQKNQLFILDIAKKICESNYNIRFVIIGNGELKSELENRIKSYGLEDRVMLAGYRNDIACWYSAMDLFILPSRFEGLPISAIEAQTSGLDVLCMDTISKETNITGNVIFLSTDCNTWVNKIIECLKHKTTSDRLNLIKIVKENGYYIKDEIKRIESEYESARR